MKSHTTFTPRRALCAAVLTTLTLAACGGDSKLAVPADTKPSGTEASGPPSTSASTEATNTAATTPTSSVDTTPSSGEPGSIDNYEDAQPAVIQIIAEGSFRDPAEGQVSAAGSGTGFVISPDGIAVTNNHVVTGAAKLTVIVGGDTTKTYNAKVLGVSECNDLAVIDINEKAPLPTLQWSDEKIKAGLKVYAAGFPLGDPEFTLTAGIVSKAESGGDMPWASLDSAIEHDAVIQPGNSGGPLIDENGHVVGINYAFKGGVTSPRYQAIRNDLAIPVIDKLKTGDFESLGINGEAFVSEDKSISGIWVAGVAPGSPASDAGLLPGDILTSLNGLQLGRDGTKADYCDVIRTSSDDKPLDAEVLRLDTKEILRGEIRGDKPLQATISIAQEINDTPDAPQAPQQEPKTEVTGYRDITDDTGAIKISVPNEWSDVSTAPQDASGTKLPFIIATPDLQRFNGDTYDTPGIAFTRIEGAPPDLSAILQNFAPTDCKDAGEKDVSGDGVTALIHLFGSCNGTNSVVAAIGFVPKDKSWTGIIIFVATSEADFEVLDRAFASAQVNG